MDQVVHKSSSDIPSPTLEERISPEVRRAFMGNFNNANEAVNELIDNCMADIMSRRQLDVNIELKKKELIVTNRNGYGMNLEEAQGFLTWGQPMGRGLSRWGVGGKAAMGYLGKGFILQFKSFNDPNAYEITDDDWERHEKPYELAKYKPKRIQVPAESHEGFVRLRIISLKMKIDEKKLRGHVSNIYRRVLMKGDATLKITGIAVEPLDIPIYDVSSVDYFKEQTPFNKIMEGWIGRLKADSPKGGFIKGGIRCCALGRLITQAEYFGHHTPSYKASLGNLIGEIEIGFVPMSVKKTEFNTESDEWEYVSQVIHKKLEPHIRSLLTIPEKIRITQREWNRLDEAKDLIKRALEQLDMRERLIQWAHEGRQSPRREEIKSQEPEKEKRYKAIPGGFHRESNGDVVANTVTLHLPLPPVPEGWVYRDDRYGAIKRIYRPRSFAPEDAAGTLKRLSEVPWTLRGMSENIRSKFEKLSDGKHELRINVKYPLYKKTKGDKWYLVETAALELAKLGVNGDITVAEYMDEVNEIVTIACQITNVEGNQ